MRNNATRMQQNKRRIAGPECADPQPRLLIADLRARWPAIVVATHLGKGQIGVSFPLSPRWLVQGVGDTMASIRCWPASLKPRFVSTITERCASVPLAIARRKRMCSGFGATGGPLIGHPKVKYLRPKDPGMIVILAGRTETHWKLAIWQVP